MGPSAPTTSPVFSLCARCKAPTKNTTILLPSLAGLSGAFDIPKAKCPPDRGSLDCVTGSPTSFFSSPSFFPSKKAGYFDKSSPTSSYSSDSSSRFPFTPPNGSGPNYINRQHAAFSKPLAIPSKARSTVQLSLSTPPLTPDDGIDGSDARVKPKDALDFLLNVFPRDGMRALPYAKGVTISVTGGNTFDGVVLELPGGSRTLYVDGKTSQTVNLRESVVAMLDLADEPLDCSALVILLERSSPSVGDLLHSLMYVGGVLVTKPPFQVDPTYILVGMDV